jgi:transposase
MTKVYPLEIKLASVNDYLDGGDSIREIAKRYSVSNTMLHRWITKYQIQGNRCTVPTKSTIQGTYFS